MLISRFFKEEFMRSRTFRLACLVASFAVALPVFAQFGHPLKGAWSGEWWLTKGQENRILLEFTWDGKELKGTLNPGANGAPLQKLTVQPPSDPFAAGAVAKAGEPWSVRFEVDTKDASGKAVHCVVDGKMDNLGAYARRLYGTWSVGNQKGEFKTTLN
jgi:hypothetical protein